MPAPIPPASAIEVQARVMFTRVLAGWASDLLRLRREGLDLPGHRGGKREVVTPAFGMKTGEPRWIESDMAPALRWRPTAA
ncbi:MAG TPA: hypothetical protein VD997_09625 [Phycisphaerales bacterium]|nr:hypothetical protein [Phycisphaerales bacterium]